MRDILGMVVAVHRAQRGDALRPAPARDLQAYTSRQGEAVRHAVRYEIADQCAH